MAKQEKILWGFFAGILVFLYLLSSTDLIIKEEDGNLSRFHCNR